jgi:hypothetical protein
MERQKSHSMFLRASFNAGLKKKIGVELGSNSGLKSPKRN